MNLSIVMPYRSRPRQLALTLESYRRFYPSLPELVIVNDGLLGSFDAEVHWPRFRLIDSGRESGGNPAPLFNAGVRAASHDVVALTNPECPHAANLADAWLADAAAGAYVVFGCRAVTELPASLDELLAERPEALGIWYQHSLHNNRRFHEFALISKARYWQVGGFSEDFTGYGWEDHDFVEKLEAAKVPVLAIDSPYCYHLEHERTPFEPTNEALYRARWGNDGRIFA
jgi:GT2 family glycosyltransferase